jgi:spoIIIJ-associated protein
MSEKATAIEIQGPDVESAIEAGLARLGVGRDEVIVEIRDAGSKGLLGIGGREATVYLEIAGEQPEVPMVDADITTEVEEESPPVSEDEAQPDSSYEAARPDDGDMRDTAIALVEELLGYLDVNASISSSLTEPDERTGEQLLKLDISGDDLGMLIGPRGETLNAVQHITRLMTAHKLRQRVNFIIDVEGYRNRREQALARLADRMARKVKGRGRPVMLEPMPPHERRVIHITLRDDEDVYTQSTGEGNRRRVRILPKE